MNNTIVLQAALLFVDGALFSAGHWWWGLIVPAAALYAAHTSKAAEDLRSKRKEAGQ